MCERTVTKVRPADLCIEWKATHEGHDEALPVFAAIAPLHKR